MNTSQTLIGRLRLQASTRRTAAARRSVIPKTDRIADLLEEAANVIECYEKAADDRINEEMHRSSW